MPKVKLSRMARIAHAGIVASAAETKAQITRLQDDHRQLLEEFLGAVSQEAGQEIPAEALSAYEDGEVYLVWGEDEQAAEEQPGEPARPVAC